jgi:hypothetical protein
MTRFPDHREILAVPDIPAMSFRGLYKDHGQNETSRRSWPPGNKDAIFPRFPTRNFSFEGEALAGAVRRVEFVGARA